MFRVYTLTGLLPPSTDLSGVWAEVLDNEDDDDRRAIVGVFFPRQPDARLAYVADGRLRRRSGVRGWLWRPSKNDVVVGGRLDDESGTGRGFAGITESLARVPTRVTLTQLCIVPTASALSVHSNCNRN